MLTIKKKAEKQLEEESKQRGVSINQIKKERANAYAIKMQKNQEKRQAEKNQMQRLINQSLKEIENLKKSTGDPEGFDYYVNQISENNLLSSRFKIFLKSIKPLPSVIQDYDYLLISKNMENCLKCIQKYENVKEGDYTASSLLEILECIKALILFIASFDVDNIGQVTRREKNVLWKTKCPFTGLEPNQYYGCKTNQTIPEIKNIINSFFDFFLTALQGMNGDELKKIQTTDFSYDKLYTFFITFFYFIGVITIDIPIETYNSKFDEINKYIQSKGFDRIWFILDCNPHYMTKNSTALCGRAYTQMQCDETEYFKIFLFNNVANTQLVNTQWKTIQDEKYSKNAKCGGYKKTIRNKKRKNRKTLKYRN